MEVNIMKNKKSRFWVFVFSFLPGAGEMYMGFMKMGLSLMLGFMLTVAVVSIICMDSLAVIPVTIYIYSFFHANNIRTMDDESFAALEDNYLFGFDGLDSVKNKLADCGSCAYRSGCVHDAGYRIQSAV